MAELDAEAMMRRWVETWKRAGPELEAIRHAEIRAADTQRAVQHLFSEDGELVRRAPIRLTSGLVEQQRWFMKLHERMQT